MIWSILQKTNAENQPPRYPTRTPMKSFRVESPVKLIENDTLNELEKRLGNINVLVDFVKGLVSDFPLPKQNAVNHQEIPESKTSCSGVNRLETNTD